MKNLVLTILVASIFISCQQEETVITPTFKESVEFMVDQQDFTVENAIPAENIKSVAEQIDNSGTVSLNDIWLEVKTKKENNANIAVINITVKDNGNEIQLLNEDIIVPLEDETSIVPLISLLSSEGQTEILNKLNDIVSGTDDSNIELTLKGESFYSTGTSGDIDVDMEMFIRYSF